MRVTLLSLSLSLTFSFGFNAGFGTVSSTKARTGSLLHVCKSLQRSTPLLDRYGLDLAGAMDRASILPSPPTILEEAGVLASEAGCRRVDLGGG